MKKYTKIEPIDFIVYDCLPKLKSGKFKSVLRKAEARKYVGKSFETVEVILWFQVSDEYGREYRVEKALLYSDERGSEYRIFMEAIAEQYKFTTLALTNIIGIDGIATIEVEESGLEYKMNVVKFVPNSYQDL